MPTLTIHGAELHYHDTGGGPETAVFVHGLMLASESFEAQRRALEGHYRVITYDLRGQGRSAKTVDRLDLDSLADDLIALVQALDAGPCHLIGFSMGSFIAMRVAARRPELVRSLVLIGASSRAELPAKMPGYTLLIAAVRLLGPRPFVGRLLPILFGETFLAAPARAAERERWAAVLRGLPRSLSCAARGSAHRRSIAHELGAITARTLVVSGEEDLAIPPALAREVQGQIPGARLQTFAATGHAVMIERPAEFNRLLLEFLAP